MPNFQVQIAKAVREEMTDPFFIARLLHGSTGRVFWVMATGAADYVSFVRDHPAYRPDETAAVYTTVELAMAATTASRGDVVLVDQEYTQTITAAAGISLDVVGTKLIGMGTGTLKPTLTFTTVVGADVVVTAANSHIENFRFVSGINDLTNFLDVNVGQLTVKGCDFVTSSTNEAFAFIDIATTFDDFKIIDCTFSQPTDPAGTNDAAGTGAIYLVDTQNVLVQGCEFVGFFETAIIHNLTTACTNLIVRDCTMTNLLTTATPFQLVAGATGHADRVVGETVGSTDGTVALLWGGLGTRFWISQNCSMGNDSAAGDQGMIIPVVAS